MRVPEVFDMMSARQARHIRCRSRLRSQRLNSLGFSELFLASLEDATVIVGTSDLRLKYWLLGFTELPPRVEALFRARGWAWPCRADGD
jgi:hypothetical protein